MQLLESSKIFKQRNNHEVPCDKNCMKKNLHKMHKICMKFFTALHSKNIIATLYIVTIEKRELTFLLIF